MAASISFQATGKNSSTVNGPSTFTIPLSVASAAGQERLVAIGGISGSGADFDQVTIDGQSATRVGSVCQGVDDGSGARAFLTFYRAPGTAGTNINVVIRVPSGGNAFGAYCALWTLNDADTLFASTNFVTVNDATLNTNTITNGAAAAAAVCYDSSSGSTVWTGLTEDTDSQHNFSTDLFTAASVAITTGATPRSISADFTPTPNKSVAAICVSFNGIGGSGAIAPPAIRIKRRAATGAAGAPAALANGELAYNEQSDTLYYGKGDSGAGVASSIVAIGGAGAFQPLDATLTALAAFNINGLLTQTAADTFTGRTLIGPAAGITISNGNGVSGNPTLALANDLAALEALGGTNNIYYRSAADTWTAVTISAPVTFSGGALGVDLSAYSTTTAIAAAYQPLDADLTAIAALTGTNVIYYRSAANTWAAITIGTGLSFSGGTLDAPVFTSSAKGEAPASGGGTTNFLRADGTWQAPPSGGGNVSNSGTPTANQVAQWIDATHIKGIDTVPVAARGPGTLVELVRQTVSVAVATVDFTTGIDATYDEYEIHVIGFQSNVNAFLGLRFSQDGGATFKAGASDYAYAYFGMDATNASTNSGVNGSAHIFVGASDVFAGAAFVGNYRIILYRPSSTTIRKHVAWNGTNNGSIAFASSCGGGTFLTDTNAINALRFYIINAGNIIGGIFVLYGVKK
jgi:hypothetical protein